MELGTSYSQRIVAIELGSWQPLLTMLAKRQVGAKLEYFVEFNSNLVSIDINDNVT